MKRTIKETIKEYDKEGNLVKEIIREEVEDNDNKKYGGGLYPPYDPYSIRYYDYNRNNWCNGNGHGEGIGGYGTGTLTNDNKKETIL